MKTLYGPMIVCLMLASAAVRADLRELVPDTVLRPLAAELSGEAAKRNLDTVTLYHRMRAGKQFRQAAEHILEQLKAYGLDDAGMLEYPADGRTMFGTQKSRPAWNVEFAELWELIRENGKEVRGRRLGSWDAVPLSLAQDSLTGEATASLVDVGAGTADADYAGKPIEGKLVLTSSQPGAIVERAVGTHGAAGIVSYAPNQKSAWWKEDDRLVRWGHLSSFPGVESFGFMISLKEARSLRARLAGGENVRLHARVIASHEPGSYSFATAAIRGNDPALRDSEILYTCHLDHPRPGANDNASGCVAILEIARSLHVLIESGRLQPPRRTIRFLWPAEIEGSLIYLSERDDAERIKAVIHLDMVGGGPETKAIFRVSGGPMSLPHFIADVSHEIGRFVNAETEAHASGKDAGYPLTSPGGGKEPLLALMEGISLGSDHDVFHEGSWRIPGFYLHDWPDRYIHTNFDTAAMIDPTKLKRSAFIGAVGGLFLANMTERQVPGVLTLLRRNALERAGRLMELRHGLSGDDSAATTRVHWEVERRKIESIGEFATVSAAASDEARDFLAGLAALTGHPGAGAKTDNLVYRRNPGVMGPMSAFGYSYARDKLGEDEYDALRLPKFTGLRGGGGEYVYEALNLVDGERTVDQIRDWLTAELGPVPVEIVGEYLEALQGIGVVQATGKADARP